MDLGAEEILFQAADNVLNYFIVGNPHRRDGEALIIPRHLEEVRPGKLAGDVMAFMEQFLQDDFGLSTSDIESADAYRNV